MDKNNNRTRTLSDDDTTPRHTWKWWALTAALRCGVGLAACLAVTRGVDIATEWGAAKYAEAKERILDLVTVERIRTEIKEPSALDCSFRKFLQLSG